MHVSSIWCLCPSIRTSQVNPSPTQTGRKWQELAGSGSKRSKPFFLSSFVSTFYSPSFYFNFYFCCQFPLHLQISCDFVPKAFQGPRGFLHRYISPWIPSISEVNVLIPISQKKSLRFRVVEWPSRNDRPNEWEQGDLLQTCRPSYSTTSALSFLSVLFSDFIPSATQNSLSYFLS